MCARGDEPTRFNETALFCVLIIEFTLFASIVPEILGLQAAQANISNYVTINYGVSWLHASGTQLYDETGHLTNIHAVNVQYGGGEGLSLSDVINIKSLGFNAFRLHVYWGLLQPRNETLKGIDESYFTTAKDPLHASVDQAISWAIQERMYVIITLCWTPTWGPPTWAFPHTTDEIERISSLLNGTATRERVGIINTWQYIAQRYRNVPNALFELKNEPSVSNASLAGNDYKLFNEEIISAIESVETISHLKIVELLCVAPAYEEIIDEAVDIDKSDLLWATHTYYPENNWDIYADDHYHDSFTWHGQYFPAGWGNGTTYVAYRLIRCAEKIHSWNKPWINTEFSKVVTQNYWDVWYDAVLSTQAEYNITGWTYHCYASDPNSENGWNLADLTTQQEVMPKLIPYM